MEAHRTNGFGLGRGGYSGLAGYSMAIGSDKVVQWALSGNLTAVCFAFALGVFVFGNAGWHAGYRAAKVESRLESNDYAAAADSLINAAIRAREIQFASER